MEHADLTEQIIGAGMRVHRTLGSGFLESVYRNALGHELRKLGLEVECGRRIRVWYDGVVVGDFVCDMLVEQVVLVETKAILKLAPSHETQVVNYLTATELEIGLLLNFGERDWRSNERQGPIAPPRALEDRMDGLRDRMARMSKVNSSNDRMARMSRMDRMKS